MSQGNDNGGGLELIVQPRQGWQGVLLPEQAATFDVVLRNTTASDRQVAGLDGNLDSPALRLLDSQGAELGRYSFRTMRERAVGAAAQGVNAPAPVVTLPAGGELRTWVNLWNYTDALAPGQYALEVTHRVAPAGPELTSARLPFSVDAARVSSAALGYDNCERSCTTLAWVAAPRGGGPPVLLARLSGTLGHHTLQQGASPLGQAPEQARVAVGQAPPDAAPEGGWIALASPGEVQLIRHDMTYVEWRTGVPLPLTEPSLVPRFPDREHAVLLATGATDQGAALVGLLVEDDEEATLLPPWQVPLPAVPTHAACVFGQDAPITLLLALPGGDGTDLVRLAVSEAGAVAAAPQVVHTTPGRVLALAADLREDAPMALLALEAEAGAPNRLTLARVPLQGDVELRPLGAVAGWPMEQDRGVARLAEPAACCLEVTAAGDHLLALTDPAGDLYGAELGQGLVLMHGAAQGRARGPHVGAVHRSARFSCFLDSGELRHGSAPEPEE